MIYCNRYKINKIIYDLIIFSFQISCFFPYVRLLPFNYDNQPNALLLGSFICILNIKRTILYDLGLLLIVFIFAIICFLFTSPNFDGIRILLNYSSLFIIANATYISLSYTKYLSYKLFKFTIYTWFFVGLIQLAITPSFMEFLLYRSDNSLNLSTGRGVDSLAVEPTFYGIICILLFIINYINFKNRKSYKILAILLLIQIFIFSKSSACILILTISTAIYIPYKIFKSKKRLSFILISTIILACTYIGYQYLITHIENRFTSLLIKMLETPSDFVFIDDSINVRFVHTFFPIKGFFDIWGIPHGFSAYENYINRLSFDSTYGQFLKADLFSQTRIPTAIGGSLFELGIVALLIYYVIAKSFIIIKKIRSNIVLYEIIFFVLLLNNITYSVSIISFLIGNIIYVSNNIKTVYYKEIS